MQTPNNDSNRYLRFTIYHLPFTIHSPMNNAQIAERFYRMAALMEVRGDDPFRLRSYRNAAEALETWPTPLKTIAAKEGSVGLQTIPGVGKAIAGKIMEMLERGTFNAWEKMIAETPESV